MKSTLGIEKPDFTRYSQEQLRQILTRLDEARYPERVQEIELRLAALDTMSNAVDPAADFPSGERRRISSSISLVINRVVPVVWVGICLTLFVSLIFSAEKQNTGWVMLIVLFVLGMLGQFVITRLTEEVFLVDDSLILVQAGAEDFVSLTRVDSVEVVDNDGVSVVLHLSSVTRFGQRIQFVPATGFFFNPFKEIPVVDELRARIASAKARATSI